MGEFWRKVYRMFGLVFVFAYLFIDRNSLVKILLAVVALLAFLEFLRFKYPKITKEYIKLPIAKEKERRNISGTTFFMVSVFLSVLLFSKPIAMLSIVFLTLGDAVAALAGMRFGRTIITGSKSFEGSLACFIACLVSGVFLATLFEPFLGISFMVVFLGAIAATIAELVSVKIGKFTIEDNLVIAVAAGLVMSIAGGL